jgi:hypothetical protein
VNSWICSALGHRRLGLRADGASAAQAFSPRGGDDQCQCDGYPAHGSPLPGRLPDPANLRAEDEDSAGRLLWTRWPETVVPKKVMSNCRVDSSCPVSRSMPPLNGSSWSKGDCWSAEA